MSNKHRTTFITLLFAAGLLIVLFGEQACVREGTAKLTTEAGFMGEQACVSCHRQEFQDWRNSHHDQAMMVANDSTVKGNFSDVSFTADGLTSKFFKKDGKFYVNTEGPDGQYRDYLIEYTFGTEPLQQYLVATEDGKYQCLRTTWDTKEKKWFHQYPDMKIPHDDWLNWSQGGQNWNSMCADCHSTNLHKNYDLITDSYHTEYSIIDVSCEACHGPGEAHVRYMQTGNFQPGKDDYNGKEHGLFLTTGIASTEQVEQCARCHARRTQITEYFDFTGHLLDHYIPEILRDNVYHPDGQIMDEDYVYGSFVQSKMYHNNVKCTDCHNPHSMQLKFEGNLLCQQCHEKEIYNTEQHHFHKPETESAQCINCHMTGKTYMGNDFRRDHSFRIPRPDQSVQFGTPNACTGCHTDQSDEWAAEAVNKWYGPNRQPHFSDALTIGSTRSESAVPALAALLADTKAPGIARATGVWYLSQIGTPQAYQAILQTLNDSVPIVRIEVINALMVLPDQERVRLLPPLLRDSMRSVRMSAANAMADIQPELLGTELAGLLQNGLKEYIAHLDVNADFPSGQIIAGQFYERRNDPAKAEQAYAYALKKDPLLHGANLNLASLYSRQGRQQEAREALEMILRLEPDHAQAHYSMGLLLAELNQLEEAAQYMAKAAELMPDNIRVYYNWGLLLQNIGKTGSAESVFQRGLQSQPGNPDLLYALAVLYIQNQQFGKARPIVADLLQRYPQNQQFLQLRQYLQQQ